MKNLNIILLIIGVCFSCSNDSESLSSNDILRNYYQDKDIEIVFENDPEHGINVIFMGDAYLRRDLEKNKSKYRHDGIKSIDFLFNSHPFLEYKKYFNAYIIYVESSIENTSNGIVVNYPFGSIVNEDNLTTITNFDAINDYVIELKGRSRSDNNLILMAINTLGSGSALLGGNIAIYGTYGSEEFYTRAFNVMLHEVGHAFASLGDEYTNPNLIPRSTNLLPNIDTTNDLNLVKWNHFIGLDGYDEVNAFEGGNYKDFGMWRPEQGSIMGGNIGSYFNAPSREAIVKRIMNLKGDDYSFETFLSLDSIYNSNGYSSGMRIGNKEKESERKIGDLPVTCINN